MKNKKIMLAGYLLLTQISSLIAGEENRIASNVELWKATAPEWRTIMHRTASKRRESVEPEEDDQILKWAERIAALKKLENRNAHILAQFEATTANRATLPVNDYAENRALLRAKSDFLHDKIKREREALGIPERIPKLVKNKRISKKSNYGIIVEDDENE